MNTWNLVFICNVVCSVMMIVFGIRFLKFQHKLNSIFGLRIKSAMKNDETWNFAHECCGKLWRNFGLIMLVVTVIVMLVLMNFSEVIIGIVGFIIAVIQCIVFFSTISSVKKSLNKKFNN